jgi:hypothetical protein
MLNCPRAFVTSEVVFTAAIEKSYQLTVTVAPGCGTGANPPAKVPSYR